MFSSPSIWRSVKSNRNFLLAISALASQYKVLVEQKAGLEQHKGEFKAYQCFSGCKGGENTLFKDSVSLAIAT